MNYQKASIGDGEVFDEKDKPGGLQEIFNSKNEKNKENAKHFLYNLALNNTIDPHIDILTNELVYDGPSIDEMALVRAAKKNGFKLLSKTLESVDIEVLGVKETFQILAIIEFNSDRKRMTTIVKNSEGKIFCYTKGADNIVSMLLKPSETYLEATQKNIDLFAQEGLRTLCKFIYPLTPQVICVKELQEEEFKEWLERWNFAHSSSSNKDELIKEAEYEMERNLSIVGATAIEDCLQEEVPETIEFFRKAGIKIWVLTGDKKDTAISIGKSSKLLTPDSQLISITGFIREEVDNSLDDLFERSKVRFT
jgi:magnesium-transporting ATPase (P-type)